MAVVAAEESRFVASLLINDCASAGICHGYVGYERTTFVKGMVVVRK